MKAPPVDEKKLIIPKATENPELSQNSVEVEYFTYGENQTPIKIEEKPFEPT